jgi:glycerophosphoryl diester phosphodiesterase
LKLTSLYRQLEPEDSPVTGYFVADFTLQELKDLTAVQPFSFRTAEHNKGEKIATIGEIFTLFKDAKKKGSAAGLYMELKHPKYHADMVCTQLLFCRFSLG